MDKPTYLRAAIEDWGNRLITTERLCEIWKLPMLSVIKAFDSKPDVWHRTPNSDSIEELLNKCRED